MGEMAQGKGGRQSGFKASVSQNVDVSSPKLLEVGT